MLPGTECDQNSMCFRDQCVASNEIDSKHLSLEKVQETSDLNSYCQTDNDINVLKDSNTEKTSAIECKNWEQTVYCTNDYPCPDKNKEDTGSLYINHVCCKKCLSDISEMYKFSGDATMCKASIVLFLVVSCFHYLT